MSVLSDLQQQIAKAVGTGLVALPKVNLLPPEIAETARFRKVQMGLGGGVLAAIGVVAMLYVGATGSLSGPLAGGLQPVVIPSTRNASIDLNAQ